MSRAFGTSAPGRTISGPIQRVLGGLTADQAIPSGCFAAGEVAGHFQRPHVENVDGVDVGNVNARAVPRKQDFLVRWRAKASHPLQLLPRRGIEDQQPQVVADEHSFAVRREGQPCGGFGRNLQGLRDFLGGDIDDRHRIVKLIGCPISLPSGDRSTP